MGKYELMSSMIKLYCPELKKYKMKLKEQIYVFKNIWDDDDYKFMFNNIEIRMNLFN